MDTRGILFDKDDAIIDLAAFWREPVGKTAEYAAKRTKGDADPALCSKLVQTAGFQDGCLIPESLVVAGTNLDILNAWRRVLMLYDISLSEEIYADCYEYLEWACLRYGKVKATADFPKLLRSLQDHGITLGIATSDNYAPTLHCLQVLGLDGFFGAIYSADRVKHPKPHPESGHAFCQQFGLNPTQVAMVGDSVNDMQFAQNSGFMGVFFQPQGGEHPLPPGAHACVQDLMELLDLFSPT